MLLRHFAVSVLFVCVARASTDILDLFSGNSSTEFDALAKQVRGKFKF
jgi:16S rRNA G966 N2-methylase RsmD